MKHIHLSIVLSLLLSACGGGGGVAQQVGQFIDDPVGGLTYVCKSAGSSQDITGTTDADGHFNYLAGQTCTFKVGNVTLGTLAGIPADGKVTPQDVAGVSRGATAAPSALVIAQFLHSLNDGSSTGKIVIPAATSTLLSNASAVTLTSSVGSISQSDLQNLVVNVAGKTLVSAAIAQSALDAQISLGNVNTSTGAVSANAPVVLNSISVTSAVSSSAAGLTTQLKAVAYYSDGKTEDKTASVTWSSSDTATVTVDSTGLAKGLKKGNSTLTASLGSVTGSFSQSVLDPTPLNLVVSYVTAGISSIQNTASTALQAIVSFTDATTQTVSSLVTWAVTSVSGGGNATISVDKTANTATLKATSPGLISTIASYLGLSSNSLGLTITPSISGVAASGLPMSGAAVTLTDSLGKTLSVVANDDGSFVFPDLTGYTQPYQLVATVQMGASQFNNYAIYADALVSGNNTVNVTPLTTAVASLVSPSGVVGNLTGDQLKSISPSQIVTAINQMNTAIAPVASQIVGSGTINPMTQTFVANGQGIDKLLDHLNVSVQTGGVAITNRMAIPNDSAPTSVTAQIDRTSGAVTPIATSAKDVVDLDGIEELIKKFRACFNLPPSQRISNKSVNSATLDPLCSSLALNNYLMNGNGLASRWAGYLNNSNIGGDSKSWAARPQFRLRISSNPDTIAVNFLIQDSTGAGYTMPDVIQRQNDGTWRLIGNQRPINLYVEVTGTHYQDLTPNTNFNNINYSRILTGISVLLDPRVTFASGSSQPNNLGVDLTQTAGTSQTSWTTFRSSAVGGGANGGLSNGNSMIKCVVMTGPGQFDATNAAKWRGIYPYGLLLKRPTSSVRQDYMAIDSRLSISQYNTVVNASEGAQLNSVCGAANTDGNGSTSQSNRIYSIDMKALSNQINPITGQLDTSMDGRDPAWYASAAWARLSPNAEVWGLLRNNPLFTFYVIDTNNILQKKIQTRMLGELPDVDQFARLVDGMPRFTTSVLSKYMKYTNTPNGVTSASFEWINSPSGAFNPNNAEALGVYSEVYKSEPGRGLAGSPSIISTNQAKTANGLWASDSDAAAYVDALPGNNFFWMNSNYAKSPNADGTCPTSYKAMSFNNSSLVYRNTTTLPNWSLGGTWMGLDDLSSAVCGNGTSNPNPPATYVMRELWIRAYTQENWRLWRYVGSKSLVVN